MGLHKIRGQSALEYEGDQKWPRRLAPMFDFKLRGNYGLR
jgi:hypothetical protein